MKFFSITLLALFGLLFTSCNKFEDEEIDTDYFSAEAVEEFRGGGKGCKACLELAYPLSIKFVDETTAEVTSNENMRETIKAWFEETGAEKTKENKPTFVFPISIVVDGETETIDSEEAFREAAKACHKGKGHRGKGKRGHGKKCFDLVFPVSMDFAGSVQEFESEDELREAVKAYHEANGRDAERPEFVFPISIIVGEETIEVNSHDEIKEATGDCKDDRRRHRARCYEPVFPISFDFDGEVKEFSSHDEVKEAMKAYREANGKDAKRPEMVFPATFKHKESGEEVTVNSKEDLKSLHESCKDEE